MKYAAVSTGKARYGYTSTRPPLTALSFWKFAYSAVTPASSQPSSACSPWNVARGRRRYGSTLADSVGSVTCQESPPKLALHHSPRPFRYALDGSRLVAVVTKLLPKSLR